MSSKNKLLYIIIGIILLLISIKAGLAFQEDFNAYATKETFYSCMCSLTDDKIIVENTGDVTSVYSLKQEGDGAPYSSLTEKAFTLKKGERKEISNYVTAPCGIEGKYGLKTTIQTEFGTMKELNQNFEIRRCANLNVVLVESSQTICPCTPAKFTFRVQNTGDFAEIYHLNVSSQYAALSENTLIIEPGKSEDVYVFITTPCGQYGEISFVFTAVAESTGVSAEIPFTMPVSMCYDYDLQTISQYSVCEGLGNVVPVTIRNTADIANSYFLGTDAAWAFFETDSINLWGRNSSIVNLDINPIGIEPANYNLTINAITGRGGIQKSLSLGVNVENCFSGSMSSETDSNQVVSGEINSLTIYVQNDGTRESTYNLNIVGPEWVSIDKNRVTVKPGAKEPIKIISNVPVEASGPFNVMITSDIENFPGKTQQLSLNVEVIKVDDAYKLVIGKDIDKIESNYDGGSLPIDFENQGIRQGNYKFFLYGEPWVSMNKGSILLNPGETGTVDFAFAPTEDVPEGTYTATIDAVLEDKNIAYSRTFDIVLRQKTLSEKVADFFSMYWIYLLISLLSLVIFTILLIMILRYRRTHPRPVEEVKEVKKIEKVEKKLEEKPFIEKERRGLSWWKILLLILLALLLLGGLGYGAYKYVYPAVYPMFIWNATNEINGTEIQEPEPIINLTPVMVLNETEVFTNATIFVNRSGLRGTGNTIEMYANEEITIPLIIQNNDEPNTYKITVSRDVDWIRTDRDFVSIPPNERETINIYVSPEGGVEQGDYNLSIDIDVGGKMPIAEQIILRISKPEPFYMEYLGYIIGGVAALILLLAILMLKDRSKKKKEEAIGQETTSKKKIKAEEVEEMPKEEGAGWKKILPIISIILLLLAIAGAAIYFGGSMFGLFMPAAPGNETAIQSNETYETGVPQETAEETPAEVPLSEYQNVLIGKGKETVIPIKIINTNQTSTFKITVQDEIRWMYLEQSEINIGPGETKTVNLIASPDETVEDGDYKVNININVDNGKKRFDKYFILNVRKSRVSDLWAYLLYVIAGFILLVVVIKILEWNKKGKKVEITEVEEEQKPVKKTSLKLR